MNYDRIIERGRNPWSKFCRGATYHAALICRNLTRGWDFDTVRFQLQMIWDGAYQQGREDAQMGRPYRKWKDPNRDIAP